MTLFLEVLGGIVAAWFAGAVGVLVALRRRNRVSPRIKGHAPLTWMVSPARAARAHRRLRRSVGGARAAIDGSATVSTRLIGLDDLRGAMDDLERFAAGADDRLVVASRCAASVRRSLLYGLDGEVRDVERLSARLSSLAYGRTLYAPGTRHAGEVADRIESLHAAEAELAALEDVFSRPSPEIRLTTERSVPGSGRAAATGRFPGSMTRYRCAACGNLTRFDVTVTRRERAFFHYSIGGELEVEEREVLSEVVESVSCRWCGHDRAVEIVEASDGDQPAVTP